MTRLNSNRVVSLPTPTGTPSALCKDVAAHARQPTPDIPNPKVVEQADDMTILLVRRVP